MDFFVNGVNISILDSCADIFEVYNAFGLRMLKEPEAARPVEPATVSKVQHAVLAALRNLIVPVPNKVVYLAMTSFIYLLLTASPSCARVAADASATYRVQL